MAASKRCMMLSRLLLWNVSDGTSARAVVCATWATMRAVVLVLAAGSATCVAKFWVRQCPTAASEAASRPASPMVTPKPATSKTATRPWTRHIMTFWDAMSPYRGQSVMWYRKLVSAVRGMVTWALKLLSISCAPPCR